MTEKEWINLLLLLLFRLAIDVYYGPYSPVGLICIIVWGCCSLKFVDQVCRRVTGLNIFQYVTGKKKNKIDE